MTVSKACYLVAVILFVIAAIGVSLGSVGLVGWGLAFVAGGVLLA